MGFISRAMEWLTVESKEVRRERLERLAAIVDHHVATWPEVGAALAEIRDANLYREVANTWPDFLRSRWDLSESYASRIIAAAELHRKTLPTGKVPRTEAIARPIAALPEAVQLEAWEDAVELAEGGDPKPEHVAAAVAKRKPGSKNAKRPKPLRLRVPGAIVVIEPGRGYTSPAEVLRAALLQIETRKAA